MLRTRIPTAPLRAAAALALLAATAAPAPAQESLPDGGFEAPALAASWERAVYGAPAQFELDDSIRHGGARSLRISATEASDAALGRELALAPDHWYRLRGFVRTRGLDAMAAPVAGALQIQRPHGAGTLASTANHVGDTDWSPVELPFRTPDDGRVRLALFLCGFGRGRGAVWFDDLSIDPVDTDAAPIVVRREPLFDAATGSITPRQCGQFIEYLCDLVPGLWAERLCDGGFEGLSPWGFEHLRATDSREHPWVPCGATNRSVVAADRDLKVAGDAAQRITVEDGAPCTVGVEQGGIFAAKDERCTFSCWMRRAERPLRVRVRLRAHGRDLAGCEFEPTTEWKRYSAPMVADATAVDATLSIEFRGPATLWLDVASLMPDETVGGWRPDAVAALRALAPGVIRFGGSVVDAPGYGDFDWRSTIGPIEKRRTLRAWGGLQPAGAGLEEIVQLIGAVGAQPLICVRVNGRTAQDAAAEVQYFNGAPDTPMGRWRAENGHPQPYAIRFWQVGNELAGPEYEAALPDFCRAMRAVDPAIELLASFPSEGVLAGAGSLIDYVCPHHYGCEDLAGKRSEFDALRALLRAGAPGRAIRVAVTEWNTTAGDVGPRRAMLWTLANALACARYHNLLQRNADLVPMAMRSNLANSFCSGVIQTDSHRLYVTPTGAMERLYATLSGATPLRVVSELPVDVAPDLSATLSADGSTLTIFAVNDTLEPIVRPLDLSAFVPRGADRTAPVEVVTLTDADAAGEPDVTNDFERPDRIAPRASARTVGAKPFSCEFPPLSLTVLRLAVAAAGR